jgi:hypothetical protein
VNHATLVAGVQSPVKRFGIRGVPISSCHGSTAARTR